MVDIGQPDVIDVAYDNPDRRNAGIEVLSFDVLKGRLTREVARRPSRLDFHQIMLVRRGTGTAMVDFTPHRCGPGTLLHQRPGQVQRFPVDARGRIAELDATLVPFTADFPPPLPATRDVLDGFGPVSWTLDAAEFAAFDRAVTELESEYAALKSAPDTDAHLTDALMRQLLSALLVRIARLPNPLGHPGPGTDVYRAFRRELERSFATTRSVDDYAARLGYSPRTLTRACLAATGRSAKQLVDARVALQAQRLLAHTDLPVAAIARSLGFTEATNFGKFFLRETDRTPGDFRRAQR